jgi:GH24 family phage-related lysozyme (muramidase)
MKGKERPVDNVTRAQQEDAMSDPRNAWEVRNPVDDNELSHETQSLDDPEEGMMGEAELSGDSDLDVNVARPEGDEQGSSREEQVKGPEAKFPALFEGIQMRMRKGKAGSCVIGVDVELAFDKAKPRGEELSPGAEDEMREPEEQAPDGNSSVKASAEAGEQNDGIEEEEFAAEAGELGDDLGEEEFAAEAGELGEDLGEEEFAAEAGELGEDIGEEEFAAETGELGEDIGEEEFAAEAGELGEDLGEEEFAAEAGEQGEDIGEEEFAAEAGEQGEDIGEEEFAAEAGELGEDIGEEEPEAEGFKSPSLMAASGKSVAGGASRKLRLSKRGAQFIARFEGIRLKLYNDPAGHCTIGIGHLVHRGRCNGSEPAEFKKGITRERAYALLQRDARKMEAAVHGLGVPLNQNQFDALVSFTYNLGPNWMKRKSGLRDALLARRYRDVPREMRKWVKAGGKVLPGLVRRREAEGRLFATAVRPVPPKKPGPQGVKVADVQPGKKNPSVLIVQKALAKAVGLDNSSSAGTFGERMKKAYAEWQRKCGFSGRAADGKPGLKSLKMLGKKYGFTVLGGTRPPSGKRVPSPVPGYKVTTPWGKRGDWAAGYHTGDDYAAPEGTPVVAVRDGKIVWSKANNRFYGNWIGQEADNGRVYVYAHLSSRLVKAGQKVKAGQTIGRVGRTGRVKGGPHLHFEDHPRGPFKYRENRKPTW